MTPAAVHTRGFAVLASAGKGKAGWRAVHGIVGAGAGGGERWDNRNPKENYQRSREVKSDERIRLESAAQHPVALPAVAFL